MRTTDVRDEMANGIDAASLPPMGPDGSPQLVPARKIDDGPPRLCEAGPCVNYHRLEVQLDAASPMQERRANGQIVDHGRSYHTEVQHYCYPTVGIETVLGAEPVVSCNRWVPVSKLFRTKGSVARAHRARVAAWEADRNRELDELAAVAMAAIAPIELVIRFEGRGLHGTGCRVSEPADVDLDTLIRLAASKNGVVILPDAEMTVTVGGDVIGNLTASPGQLELVPGTEVIVCISPRKDSPA